MSDNTSVSKDILEKIKDYALSIALVGYVSGFIVTSIYLGKYGIANFDIVRAHYVLTGIVFLLFAFTCLFPSYISWELYTRHKQNTFKVVMSILGETMAGNLIAVGFISAPLYFVAAIAYKEPLSFSFPLLSIGISLLNSVLLVLTYLAIKFFLIFPAKFRDWFFVEVGSPEAIAANASSNVIVPIFLLSLILVVVFGYSLLVYPTIPQQLGGGARIPVEVTYKSSSITKTLYLLDRTSTTVIFLDVDCGTEAEKAIEVSSDDILSMSSLDHDKPVCSSPALSPRLVLPTVIPSPVFAFPTSTPSGTPHAPHGRP